MQQAIEAEDQRCVGPQRPSYSDCVWRAIAERNGDLVPADCVEAIRASVADFVVALTLGQSTGAIVKRACGVLSLIALLRALATQVLRSCTGGGMARRQASRWILTSSRGCSPVPMKKTWRTRRSDTLPAHNEPPSASRAALQVPRAASAKSAWGAASAPGQLQVPRAPGEPEQPEARVAGYGPFWTETCCQKN